MKKEAIVIIANALIWGFVIIACALALRGTGAYQEIQLILAGGVVASSGLLVTTSFVEKSQDKNNV